MSTMSKKAQGISINVIVIAAIALLVLVVLAVLVLSSVRNTEKGTTRCVTLGGTCERDCDNRMELTSATDCGNQYCCLIIGGG